MLLSYYSDFSWVISNSTIFFKNRIVGIEETIIIKNSGQRVHLQPLDRKYLSLVKPSKILLPPLHIKWGFIKIFVKAIDRMDAVFYTKKKFPKISDAKLKESIFVGPQIKVLITDPVFEEKINDLEKQAWISFKDVVANFIGNHKSDSYKAFGNELLLGYHVLGCNMSLFIS